MKEVGVKAVFIFDKPLSDDLKDLDWTWEEETLIPSFWVSLWG